jgi:hypothetical protein
MKKDYIKSCLMKASFATEADALLERNKEAYLCLFCGNWHRSTPKDQRTSFHHIISYEQRLQRRIIKL